MKWLKEQIRPWLDRGEIPADPLTNLTTTDNGLSVFVVEDDRSNLERIITAHAATRGKLDKYDYLLFDRRILSTVGIKTQATPAKTQDSEVNSWHLDLVELSGAKLLALVTEILRSNFETDRRLPNAISNQVKQAVNAGHMRQERLPKRLRDEVFST